MTKSWRDIARPIVAEVLRANAGQPPEVIKAALYDAYPFGMRKYLPYKMWLDECKRQRGLARKRPNENPTHENRPHEDQAPLFSDLPPVS